MRLQLVVLVVAWAQVANVAADCRIFSSEGVCTHIGDVADYGNERWHQLVVNNTVKEPLMKLPRNAFSATPKVQYLTVDGWLHSLEQGAFSGVSNIYSLSLVNNRIQVLPPEIFAKANIYTIDLDNCGIETLQPGCFRNVQGLKRINIMRNPLKHVPTGVFNNLDINDLYLQYDEITSIEQGAFKDMSQLEVLSLRGNYLIEFDAARVLGRSPKLVWLSLRENRITRMTAAMLKDMPELMTISLENNQIKVVEQDTFSDSHTKLEHIYFNNNSLEVLPANVFPAGGLPKLEYLYVDYNRLTFLEPTVLSRLPKLEQLCVGGNPLFCGCYTDIVRWRENKKVDCWRDTRYFSSGQRPSCVAIHNDHCVYGDNSADAVAAVKEYIAMLPKYIDDT